LSRSWHIPVEDDEKDDEKYDEKYHEYEDYGDYRQRGQRQPKAKKQSTDLIPGIVIRALGHHFEVQTFPDDDPSCTSGIRLCQARGRLLQEKGQTTLVAVGDRVRLRPKADDTGQIEEVEERESVLSRRQPGTGTPIEDVILANPDQVLVVFAIAQPEPHLRMLDRFLVIAEANELPAIICINKIDLENLATAQTLMQPYVDMGYSVIYTSATGDIGIDELRAQLLGSTSVLTGPSGVGKSSLLNALYPEFDLLTGDLRTFLAKGSHTTRTARMLLLPTSDEEDGQQTFVADTPGIRELGLYEIDPADLGFYYMDIEPHVNECRYPNCTHNHEPGCAVRAAVEGGLVTQARYESYLRLLEELSE